MSLVNDFFFSKEGKAQLREQFNNAIPYRNLVIDNFLKEDVAQSLVKNFPSSEQMRRHYKGLNEQKSEGSNFENYHEIFTQVKNYLQGEAFLSAFSEITGITDIICPDDHRGAGVHQGFDGSFLDVHVDYSVHPILNIHRRLNLLVFLNPDWEEQYGGKLELWDAEVRTCHHKIVPTFNRAVIFETSKYSYHGYDTINVPEGVTRKSMYFYFFTPINDKSKVEYHDTIFKGRPSESAAKRTKTALKENAKNIIKKGLFKIGAKSLFNKYE